MITKSFCSIFPLKAFIEAPDFDVAIRKASEDYLAKQEMTTNIPGFGDWIKRNK